MSGERKQQILEVLARELETKPGLLLGLSHIDEVNSLAVSSAETQVVVNQLIDGFFADR